MPDTTNAGPYRVDIGTKPRGHSALITLIGPSGVVARESCGDYSKVTFDFWCARLNTAHAAGRASAQADLDVAREALEELLVASRNVSTNQGSTGRIFAAWNSAEAALAKLEARK